MTEHVIDHIDPGEHPIVVFLGMKRANRNRLGGISAVNRLLIAHAEKALGEEFTCHASPSLGGELFINTEAAERTGILISFGATPRDAGLDTWRFLFFTDPGYYDLPRRLQLQLRIRRNRLMRQLRKVPELAYCECFELHDQSLN